MVDKFPHRTPATVSSADITCYIDDLRNRIRRTGREAAVLQALQIIEIITDIGDFLPVSTKFLGNLFQLWELVRNALMQVNNFQFFCRFSRILDFRPVMITGVMPSFGRIWAIP